MSGFWKNPIVQTLYQTAINYATPTTLTYFWNFGIFALVCLGIQIITGILLTMHYIPEISLAFDSVERIMREVNSGWLLRYVHANGASAFFVVVYLHIFRGLYYGSFIRPRHHLWNSGVLIFFLMVLTAFIGYVLPWGQMSYWGATVITSFATSVPFIGEKIAIWLWSGFVVAQPTLNKFLALHYLLPFVIAALVGLHLVLLHSVRSSNPTGTASRYDNVPFGQYYIIKDFLSVLIFFLLFFYLVFFNPNLLGHADNYIPANPDVTPSHIVPEWYFLPFYAILRAIPNKLLGVIAMVLAILVLFTLPYIINANVRYHLLNPNSDITKLAVLIFIATFFVLMALGGRAADEPYVTFARIYSVIYFGFFLVVSRLPAFLFQRLHSMLEKKFPTYKHTHKKR